MQAGSKTRLAPSPTGALHLGNARTFLVNWLMARQNGWAILLRIEDIDGPRTKAGADQEAIEDLRWLGLDWDEGPVYQRSKLARYADATQDLLHRGLAYPCVCSRREAEQAASAPHAEDGAVVYPGTCRGRYRTVEEARAESGKTPAIRFAVPPGTVQFDDAFHGRRSCDVAGELGDFVIAKADGTPAYQLAVVLDDAEAGITHVVRGDDLMDSTPRQILLYEAMTLSRIIPRYCHLPLVVGEDGKRLAKRHGDTRLSQYRRRGVSAGRMLSLLSRWCGIDAREDATARDLVGRFSLDKLPRRQIIFSGGDDRWLLG